MKSPWNRRVFVVLLVLLLHSPGYQMLVAQQSEQAQQSQEGTAESEKPKRPPEKTIHKVIELQHIDGNEVWTLLGLWGATIRLSPALRVITVAGAESEVTAVEEAIKRLDVPSSKRAVAPQNVELVIHLLGATEQAEEAVGSSSTLQRVVTELKSKFPYKGYRLLETMAARARVGHKASVQGLFPERLFPGAPVTPYGFEAFIKGISLDDRGVIISLEALRFSSDIPAANVLGGTQWSYRSVEIRTNLDVREGQAVVVGKAGTEGDIRGIFLVLTADVVE